MLVLKLHYPTEHSGYKHFRNNSFVSNPLKTVSYQRNEIFYWIWIRIQFLDDILSWQYQWVDVSKIVFGYSRNAQLLIYFPIVGIWMGTQNFPVFFSLLCFGCVVIQNENKGRIDFCKQSRFNSNEKNSMNQNGQFK